MEKQLCKLNCSYGKVSHVLKTQLRIILKNPITIGLEQLFQKYSLLSLLWHISPGPRSHPHVDTLSHTHKRTASVDSSLVTIINPRTITDLPETKFCSRQTQHRSELRSWRRNEKSRKTERKSERAGRRTNELLREDGFRPRSSSGP